ncbi:MAG: helix-turn-helix transcriptional regulator [Inhella sp.]
MKGLAVAEAETDLKPTSNMKPLLLLDLQGVCDALNCSASTVYRLVAAGQLAKPVKLLKSSRWRVADVEAFVNQAESA